MLTKMVNSHKSFTEKFVRKRFATITKSHSSNHNVLGPGFMEIVFKDALELEFKNAGIPYKREVRYDVNYKGTILPYFFHADFVVFHSIILEVKSNSAISGQCIAQAMNYLKVSGNRLVIVVNFGERKLVV